MSSVAPKRRQFRFSLMTLFVVVTFTACAVSWLGYGKSWVRQRQALLESGVVLSVGGPTIPPLQLWILGEAGHNNFIIQGNDRENALKAQTLFPEARISCCGPEFD